MLRVRLPSRATPPDTAALKAHLHFQERAPELAQFVEAAITNLKRPTTPKIFQSLSISGGSGSGKTRLPFEAYTRLSAHPALPTEFAEAMAHPESCILYTNFMTGEIDEEDMKHGLDVALGLRFAVAFLSANDLPFASVRRLLRQLPVQQFTLPAVLHCVAARAKALHKLQSRPLLMLIADEFHELARTKLTVPRQLEHGPITLSPAHRRTPLLHQEPIINAITRCIVEASHSQPTAAVLPVFVGPYLSRRRFFLRSLRSQPISRS